GRGRPSVPADVVATVMVLQALEGLSDREAAAQLRQSIAWKVACGLSLVDPGFHPTVLTLWRTRLRTSARPERVFEAVRAVIAQTGVLAGRQRRALDSTLLDDAVATQDTVTQLVAAVRRVRRLVPAAAALRLGGHDYDHDPGKPQCAWDDPRARDGLVSALVGDALAVLAVVEDGELDADQAEAVGLLGLVAGQDVEPGEQAGSFRVARQVAPDRVISVVDPDARHMHKSRSSYRDGYKAHLAVEPETGLITGTELTPANAADGPTGVGLLAGEPPGLQVLGDSAYGGGETRAALRAAGHTQTIKPIPLRPAVPGGFTRDDFAVDLAAGTVSCPAGHTVAITPAGKAIFDWRCGPCPLRTRCTTAKHGKTLNLHPQEAELAAARRRAADPAFQASYRRWRPMVERSIAWLVAKGHRRVRYRGLARNQLGLSLRVAAINLRRLITMGLDHTDAGWMLG
ncbi:MAG TPA: IS1182 family transposase, partial [Actinomycetes bacterium]|nr:IS1182 family transposase [Actinomycetes bacterium]